MADYYNTMRAWTFTRRGFPAQVLSLRDDIPKPNKDQLGPDEIIVKVSHVTIDHGFAFAMSLTPHFNNNIWIPNFSLSGLVEAVGSQVNHLKPGDAVFGGPDPKKYPSGKYNGVMAEYAIMPAAQAVRKPDWISFEAASGLSGVCAAVQFADMTKLSKGDKVLITAASGALGSSVVQVARSRVGSEGTIIGTCSAANEQLVTGLGADEVIDYRTHPRLDEYLTEHHSSNPFDAIIDVAGTDDRLYMRSSPYLKADGVYLRGGVMSVTHVASPSVWNMLWALTSYHFKTRLPETLGGGPRRGLFHSADINPETLQRVGQLVEDHQLTCRIDSEWPMEQVLQAYERAATARARGKIIVRIQDV